MNIIGQKFKFIISKGILTIGAKKKTNPDHSHPHDFFSEKSKQSVTVSPSVVFKVSVLTQCFIHTMLLLATKGHEVILAMSI